MYKILFSFIALIIMIDSALCQVVFAKNNPTKNNPTKTNPIKAHSSEIPSVEQILSQVHECSPTITLRTQDLSKKQITQACKVLSTQEQYFHQLFHTKNKPIKGDHNKNLRANVYNSKADYDQYAPVHFNIPTDNGGMYLEGNPSNPDNQAEFVAYEKNGKILNLEHEYVHYLDGRFNSHGNFCDLPHDDHSAPENCPKPHKPLPHHVWWSEGLAEYVYYKNNHIKALENAASHQYKLSELFNTSYHKNTGGKRIYQWGYLAIRFMMEKHRNSVEEMLQLTRTGNWEAYQQLLRNWGTSFDTEFDRWLDSVSIKKPLKTNKKL